MRVSLRAVNKEIYKKKNTVVSVLVWSPLRVSLSLSHTHIGLPQSLNLNFPISIPITFIWESPLEFFYCRNLCYCFVDVNIITDEDNFLLIFEIP